MLRLFRRRSVDSILSVFNKTVSQLRTLAEEKRVESERHSEEALKARRKATDASLEAARAETAAEKIESLLV